LGFLPYSLLICSLKHLYFEWLEWNGTNKNDWFFVLWWGLVATWFLFGVSRLWQTLR
jgi:hypothetical protein